MKAAPVKHNHHTDMKQFLGTKLILARPMTRGEYNDYRGWEDLAGEDQNVPGYLVEYTDGGKANHADHKGYISWSPADVFERSYRATDGLNFGLALEALKAGKRVARAGWNGKGMWLHLVQSHHWTFTDGKQDNFALLPFIAMKTAQEQTVPWLASQTDMLSDDWAILES